MIAMMLLFSIGGAMAVEVPMKENNNPDCPSGPHRSPALQANYDEYTGELALLYSEAGAAYTYHVYDEDGILLVGGTGAFNLAGTSSINLGVLPSGYYLVEVVFDTVSYVGRLYREE